MLSSDDAKYGGSGTPLAPVKAVKEERHGLPYSIELTLPPRSTVFYELKAGGGSAARTEASKAEAKTGQAPEEKPKAVSKPRAQTADAAGDTSKTARKPRAKKSDTNNS